MSTGALIKAVLEDGPAAYWPMDDLGFPCRDLGSGTAQTLSSSTGSPTPNATALLPGGSSKGVNFSGADALSGGSPAKIFVGNTTAYTLEAWFISTGAPGFNAYRDVLRESNNNSICIRMNEYAGMSAWFRDGGGNLRAVGGGTCTAGKAYHMVVTAQVAGDGLSVTIKAYWQGVLLSTVTPALSGSFLSITAPGAALQIGRYFDGSTASSYWAGTIGHVALYNAVLPADRVKVHFQTGIRSGVSY